MTTKKKLVIGIPTILFIAGYIIWGREIVNDYYKDHVEFGDSIYFRGQVTPVQESEGFVSLALGMVNTISACNFFPKKISDLYDSTNFKLGNPSCIVWKANPPYKGFDVGDHRPIWIDPWGHPYQIRYDRERRKLQVRSHGRYLWTETDDIAGETTWGGIGNMMNEEIKKCDSLPKDDMSCIFNRGWH